MEIIKLEISGYKSLCNVVLERPSPFTVFVGANASGKSNIFEALEFTNLCNKMVANEAIKLFGNPKDIFNETVTKLESPAISVKVDLNTLHPERTILLENINDVLVVETLFDSFVSYHYHQFPQTMVATNGNTVVHERDKNFDHFNNFSRIFINEQKNKVRRNYQDDSRLVSDASNLEKVLKRILTDSEICEEVNEVLTVLVPGFKKLEIRTEEMSGSDHLVVHEKYLNRPLSKYQISDGTYNLFAILAALYQSKEPQFLCLEEPENGLNPKVVKELVMLLRRKCEENGHFIWLNTHSQSLVAELMPHEIVLVDKVKGDTVVKQMAGFNLNGMRMDEALLTNALGGGLPW